MRKQLAAVGIALAMLVTLLPASASAAIRIVYFNTPVTANVVYQLTGDFNVTPRERLYIRADSAPGGCYFGVRSAYNRDYLYSSTLIYTGGTANVLFNSSQYETLRVFVRVVCNGSGTAAGEIYKN